MKQFAAFLLVATFVALFVKGTFYDDVSMEELLNEAIPISSSGGTTTTTNTEAQTVANNYGNIGAAPQMMFTEGTTDFGKIYDMPYQVTQLSHGLEYGHNAIDIMAVEGATLYSPIDGTVVVGYDGYGNSYIVITGNKYTVTMMHGIFNVPSIYVTMGTVIGSESNIGQTFEAGIPCNGKPHCGSHVHIDVKDTATGAHVDVLSLMR